MSGNGGGELVELIFDHLCDEQPEAVAELPDAEILRRIRLGIERARERGLGTDGAVTAFVTLMFLVAPNFDEHPRIREALEDAAGGADERMRRIFEKTSEADWDEAAARACAWEELE